MCLEARTRCANQSKVKKTQESADVSSRVLDQERSRAPRPPARWCGSTSRPARFSGAELAPCTDLTFAWKDTNTPSLQGLHFPDAPYDSGSVWAVYEMPRGAEVRGRYGRPHRQVNYESPDGVTYLADNNSWLRDCERHGQLWVAVRAIPAELSGQYQQPFRQDLLLHGESQPGDAGCADHHAARRASGVLGHGGWTSCEEEAAGPALQFPWVFERR